MFFMALPANTTVLVSTSKNVSPNFNGRASTTVKSCGINREACSSGKNRGSLARDTDGDDKRSYKGGCSVRAIKNAAKDRVRGHCPRTSNQGIKSSNHQAAHEPPRTARTTKGNVLGSAATLPSKKTTVHALNGSEWYVVDDQ